MKTINLFMVSAFVACVTLSVVSCEKEVLSSDDQTTFCGTDDGRIDEDDVLPCHEDRERVNIRIANSSESDYIDLLLNPRSVDSDYGTVLSGDTSCYHSFSSGYEVSYIRFVSAEEELIYQPIDWVGEVPMEAGNYLYDVYIEDDRIKYVVISE